MSESDARCLIDCKNQKNTNCTTRVKCDKCLTLVLTHFKLAEQAGRDVLADKGIVACAYPLGLPLEIGGDGRVRRACWRAPGQNELASRR